MSQFLTVKEAAQIVGKSPSSIRRVIYPIIQDDQHPDRDQIQPSIDDVRQLRLKGENFAWRVSEEFIRREVPVETEAKKGTASTSQGDSPDGTGELLSMLRRELDIKNHQITQQSELIGKQMELISGLSERVREGNMLIGALHQQLALPGGKSRPKSGVVEAKSTEHPTPKKGNVSSGKAAKPKRNFFARMFS